MPRYRHSLPQLSGRRFLTDGGLETTLVFHDGIDLPFFAAFDLLKSEEGRERLRRYYARYAAIATQGRAGFVLESPTWRASRDWGERLGYSAEALAAINRAAIDLMDEVAARHDAPETPFVISGNLGPRGDGYSPTALMGAAEAEAYHAEQIETFADTEADLVTALTMNYPEEAIGIARAAAKAEMPVVLSFTVETDGRLPTGHGIREAIEAVDDATAGAPAYYMINCAHPTHFRDALERGESWIGRVRGIRANASRRSHRELDEATSLDAGDPAELGRQYGELVRRFPHFDVVGGCCGTDHRHIEAIADNCLGRGRMAGAA